MVPKFTQEKVIKQFREAHKHELYRNDYSKMVYKGDRDEVEIICNLCNVSYWQSPHLHKRGCNHLYCSNPKSKRTTDDVIKGMMEAHKHEPGRYEYPDFVHTNSETPINILCNWCGTTFPQSVHSHKAGHGCPTCDNKNLTQEDILERFVKRHGDDFGYDRVVFKGCTIDVEIYCKKCQLYFFQKPRCHALGQGCSTCRKKTEGKVKKFLDEQKIKYKYQPKFPWCKVVSELPYDFLINDDLLEVDGKQHFEDVMNWQPQYEVRNRDIFKTVNAVQNGRKVIRISQEDIWNDTIDWKGIILAIINNEIVTKQVTYIAKNINMYNSLDTQLKDPDSYNNAIKYIFNNDDIDDE